MLLVLGLTSLGLQLKVLVLVLDLNI